MRQTWWRYVHGKIQVSFSIKYTVDSFVTYYNTAMEYWLCSLGMLPWCIWELCTLAPVTVWRAPWIRSPIRPLVMAKIHGPTTSYLYAKISYYLFAELWRAWFTAQLLSRLAPSWVPSLPAWVRTARLHMKNKNCYLHLNQLLTP